MQNGEYMDKKKVELLSPAGDFECFMAAVNAGADAIYLGGNRFGARAYANNFSEEEIIKAVHIAHLFDRRVYLTVNTLVKEKEFHELKDYIAPLYESGIDGVIVQDLGVLTALRESFPRLAIHVSTQMTVTGIYGARLLKELGACRIVPARELSLQEIKDIHEDTDIEIEAFIHGAMCYSYSGQCLFSSILGQRSGNRGRCAGPCRLPYAGEKGKAVYPLSLKDLYTLPMIPELIKAGIYSFKIEGRMKSPAYVAGVTSVYRKYIDKYLSNPDKKYIVSKDDEEKIRHLYIRSDICGGYYKQHNGKDMITLKEPGYSGNDAALIQELNRRYVDSKPVLPVRGYSKIHAGKRAELTLSCGNNSVTAVGDIAGSAVNRPLDETQINERLSKLGDTYFVPERFEADTDGQAFMPVKSLNSLRREACSMLEKQIIQANTDCAGNPETDLTNGKTPDLVKKRRQSFDFARLTVSLTSLEQLCAAADIIKSEASHSFNLCVNSDIFLGKKENTDNALKILWSLKAQDKKDSGKAERVHILLALPHILRKRSYRYLDIYGQLIFDELFDGILVRNHEELEWALELGYDRAMFSDHSLYAWNNRAKDIYLKYFDRITLPLELNRAEYAQIEAPQRCEMPIYGYIPLMYSANCVRKTMEACIKDSSNGYGSCWLTDRYNNRFCVIQNCFHCYNILYNTVPLSLHGNMDSLLKREYASYRLAFTVEDAGEMSEILKYYISAVYEKNTSAAFPVRAYTNGHYKRGVE